MGPKIHGKAFPKQVPEYKNKTSLFDVERELAKRPPLVFAEEVRRLRRDLLQLQKENLLLQGGDCAESFLEHNANNIRMVSNHSSNGSSTYLRFIFTSSKKR